MNRLIRIQMINFFSFQMKENSKAVKSSTAFFNQLEDEVKSHIKSTESKKRKKDKPHIIAKKIKL